MSVFLIFIRRLLECCLNAEWFYEDIDLGAPLNSNHSNH